YKLLRFVNSPLFGWSGTVGSIEHGLALVGEDEIRKWISVVAVSGILEDQPTELMKRSLVRAAFSEALAPAAGLWTRSSEIFLMGLLSLVGTMLGCSLREVLNYISLKSDLRRVLLAAESGREEPSSVNRLFRLVLAYESADWDRVSALADQLELSEKV